MHESEDRFREKTLALFVADLAGFTRAVAALSPLALASSLDAYYARAGDVVARHGGRVVKFMGDACFAVFAEERCADAVSAAIELACDPMPLPGIAAGANVHLAVVAEGEFGLDRRYDVVGAGVNHLFRMGGGAGVRISEAVYGKLPNDRRGPWREQGLPGIYTADLTEV